VGRVRPLGALLVVVIALLAAAAPASATPTPHCDSEVWSRPGLERTLDIVCFDTDKVRIAEQPAGAVVTGDHFDGWSFRFRLATGAAPPATDRLVLDLDGGAGPARHTVTIHNIPLSQNTPPRCDPVDTAQRSDGLHPAVVVFNVFCWDDEHDDFTLNGSGPGTHLDAPLVVHNGRDQLSVPSWRYRTLVPVGPELSSYWATDSQGARSAAAPISVMVGPLVDRRPTCRPNPAEYWYDPLRFPVYTRPGATRRFGIVCEDEDGDAVEPRVARPPQHGAITRFDVGEPSAGWWGMERFVDATYTPADDREGEDPLGIVASGPYGDGPVADLRMLARPLPANGGSGCGWSGGSTLPGQPVELKAWCSDDDGDPLSATIADPPAHGTVDDPVVEPDRYGDQAIRLRYTPDEGFEGSDYVTLDVDDGHGASHDLEFEIGVASPAPPPEPVQWTPGADPEGWFWSPAAWARRPHTPAPAVGQAPAVSPATQARRALRTRSVRLARRLGPTALVFAPRARPAGARRVRALAVTCAVRCRVQASAAVGGARAARVAGLRVSPGRARVLMLRLSPAQRSRLRRTRNGYATFRLTVRPAVGSPRTGRVRLRLKG
jgi:Bacterial Ig domain